MRNALLRSFTMLAILATLTLGSAACGGSGSDGGGNPNPPPSGGGEPPTGGGGGGGGSARVDTLMVQVEGLDLMDPSPVCAKAGFTGGKHELDCDDDGCTGGPFTASNGNVAVNIFDGANCSREVPLAPSTDGGSYLEVNGTPVTWGQPNTLLWLFGLHGTSVGEPSGSRDDLDAREMQRVEIDMHYHGPTDSGARNPARLIADFTRWERDVELHQTTGDADYKYVTWVRPGLVRKMVFREKTPGEVPGQEDGRDAGWWEVDVHVNGCDITRSNDGGATFWFQMAEGDNSPRDRNGNRICN